MNTYLAIYLAIGIALTIRVYTGQFAAVRIAVDKYWHTVDGVGLPMPIASLLAAGVFLSVCAVRCLAWPGYLLRDIVGRR